MTEESCLFCRIVGGAIPADVVHDSDAVLAFRDISPQAPSHVLVIPKTHISSLAAAEDEHDSVLGEILRVCRDVAWAEGVSDDGYRIVANTGADGGQTVDHLHVHVLGGRALNWPPG